MKKILTISNYIWRLLDSHKCFSSSTKALQTLMDVAVVLLKKSSNSLFKKNFIVLLKIQQFIKKDTNTSSNLDVTNSEVEDMIRRIIAEYRK